MFLTRDQARALDRRAIEELGVPGVVLMENAGRGMAELLLRAGHQRSGRRSAAARATTAATASSSPGISTTPASPSASCFSPGRRNLPAMRPSCTGSSPIAGRQCKRTWARRRCGVNWKRTSGWWTRSSERVERSGSASRSTRSLPRSMRAAPAFWPWTFRPASTPTRANRWAPRSGRITPRPSRPPRGATPGRRRRHGWARCMSSTWGRRGG